MNREIKFRGKDKNNYWVYGNLVYMHGLGNTWTTGIQTHSGDKYRAYASVNVDPRTVGQYTGFEDDWEREVYEGDIFKDNDGYYWFITFEDGCFLAKGGEFNSTERLSDFTDWISNDPILEVLVVGNMYENEDLITAHFED